MIHSESRRIRILRDSVARQIAAGEVIDRPFSVVRELLDNSIDAGSTSVDVYVEAGGVSSVRVVDNGSGMTKEDLDLCWHSHATSKIEQVEDLDRLVSLGFRGEALASMAACSRLTITSKTPESPTAHRLRVDSSKLVSLEVSPGETGTVVEVADLFYSLPARRKFLKTPSAETTMCKSTLIEKSLPFPNVSFRFFSGGEMKLYLPAAASLDERIQAAHPTVVNPDLLHRVEAKAAGFTLTVVMGGPSLYRRDRRYIWTYVNNRRINEFALTHAVEYGFADHIPGGNFPVAFLFISVDPELVDFNVHPAKREARFRNLPEIHHALVTAIGEHLQRFKVSFSNPRAGASPGAPPAAETREEAARFVSAAEERRAKHRPTARFGGPLPHSVERLSGELAPRPAPPAPEKIHYYGQVFRLFLLASVEDRLFIVDQHAAHERVLFERLRSRPGPPQNLLVPVTFEATPDEERMLEANVGFCKSVGVELWKRERGSWEIRSVPSGFRSLEDEIVDFAKRARGGRRELEQELYARMSCRAAIKEGDSIDEMTALELIRQTFELEIARCPHGRPIWYELSRDELHHLVGRL